MTDLIMPGRDQGKTKGSSNLLLPGVNAAVATLPAAKQRQARALVSRAMCACSGDVPCVSRELGESIAARGYRQARREAILQASMAWLVAEHQGVTTALGIVGRDLTEEERRSFVLEVMPASLSPCPYRTPNGCLLMGLGPTYRTNAEELHEEYAFLPMIIARQWDRPQLRALMEGQAIANAKTQFLTRHRAFPLPSDLYEAGEEPHTATS